MNQLQIAAYRKPSTSDAQCSDEAARQSLETRLCRRQSSTLGNKRGLDCWLRGTEKKAGWVGNTNVSNKAHFVIADEINEKECIAKEIRQTGIKR